jgi:hypothetical protein
MAVAAAVGRRQVVVKDPGYKQQKESMRGLYPGSFTTTAARSATPPCVSPVLPFSCCVDFGPHRDRFSYYSLLAIRRTIAHHSNGLTKGPACADPETWNSEPRTASPPRSRAKVSAALQRASR